MSASTLTSKGQVTVPKAIRDRLGLVEGDVLEFTVTKDGGIAVRPRDRSSGAGGVLREFARAEPVSTEDMKRAVRRRAAEKHRRETS